MQGRVEILVLRTGQMGNRGTAISQRRRIKKTFRKKRRRASRASRFFRLEMDGIRHV